MSPDKEDGFNFVADVEEDDGFDDGASIDLSDEEARQKQLDAFQLERSNKASVRLLRQMTKALAKGSETDNAVRKVLDRFVKRMIFGPGTIREEDESLEHSGVDIDGANLMTEHERRENMLISELATCMPMVKIAEGSYLLGAEKRHI